MEGVQAAMVDTASQYTGDYLPNDPYGKTWYNFGWTNTLGYCKAQQQQLVGGSGVDAPGAWEYKDRLSPVQVGVIDNGFDQKHEDLSIEIVNPDVVNREDHGTIVAASSAPKWTTARGIAGLAPMPCCTAATMPPDWIQRAGRRLGHHLLHLGRLFPFLEKWRNGPQMVINLSAGADRLPPHQQRRFSEEAVDRNDALASQYMASLLIRGYDFVVVQSAGNGAADGLGVDARYNGLFSAIDADNCVTANGKVTVTAQDIMDRVIIVGAAGERDENGVYMQASFSNGGDQGATLQRPA